MYRNSSKPAEKKGSKLSTPKISTPKNSTPTSQTKETRNIRSAAPGGGRSSVSSQQVRSIPTTQGNTSTDLVTNAVFEYLEKRQMYRTLEIFRDEMNRAPSAMKDLDLGLSTNLLEDFDKGERGSFFARWNKFIAPQATKDAAYDKIEFYLHLYFLASSIHKNSTQVIGKEEVAVFKKYLDTKGRDLAQTTEVLQYYAFPYVPNPTEHPYFKHIFTKEWASDLRNKLQFFLSLLNSNKEAPLIYQMYNAYVNNLNEKEGQEGKSHRNEDEPSVGDYAKIIAQLEASNQDLINVLQDYNEKYNNLMTDLQIVQRNEEIARSHLLESHGKWIAFLKELLVVTNDLVGVVDNQKKGSFVGDKMFDALRRRVQKYENFLNSNLDDFSSQSQDISTFDKISTSQDVGTPDHSSIIQANYRAATRVEEKSPYVFEQQQSIRQSYIALNYEKIKSQIVNQSGNEVMQCAILQALRWRITRTRGAALRREVIVGYSKNDILDMRRQEPCVLDQIFKHRGRKIAEYGSRFINSLTSDYYGRTYLLESDKVVNLLIQIFITEKGDTVVRRNCLGALQKLSLRKRPQFIMIGKDIIRWILHALKNEKNSLGEYFYEYATALLMNLSLRSSGKKKCEESDVEVLEILADLLEHDNMQVRSFVNGTLYSLLSSPSFKEQAHAMGMSEILSYLMENADERYKKQIHYIFQRLNNDQSEEEEESQNETNDEDNDYDDMDDEDEIGEDDDMEDNLGDPNMIIGEDLLRKHFSLSGPEAIRQNSMIQEAMDESRSFIKESTIREARQTASMIGTPLDRPTTPNMLNKIIQQQTGMQNMGETSEGFKTKPKLGRTVTDGQNDYPRILENQSEIERQRERQHEREIEAKYINEEDYFSLSNRQSKNNNKIEKNANGNGNEDSMIAFQSKPRVLRSPPEEKMVKGNPYKY